MSDPSRESRVEHYRAESLRADDLVGRGEKEEALSLLEACLQAASDRGDVDYRDLFEAELLSYRTPNYPRQIELLNHAIRWVADQHLPADHFLLRSQGAYHILQGDVQAALEWFDKALAENPKDASAMRERGVSLSMQGDEQTAIEWYDKALVENPKDSHAMRNRGVSLWRQGDLQAALEWFGKALAENPKDAHGYGNRAWCHAFQECEDAAVSDMARAAALDPKTWGGPFRAICRMFNRDIEEERKKRFPDQPVPKPSAKEALEELPSFIEFVRNAFREEAEGYLKQQKEGEEARGEFLKPESHLDPNRTLFMVLRKWNSFTPLLPAEEEEPGRGGGYFVWHQGHGTVIDPGYDFIRNFDEARCRLCDIDNVILTHAHNDHTIDFESLRTLLHEFNAREGIEPKKVRFFLNNGAFRKFAGMIDLHDHDFTERVFTLNAGNKYDLLGGGRIRVLPAYHDELLARDQAVGLLFTLPTSAGERRLLLTSDTGLFPLKRDERGLVPDTSDPEAEIWRQYLKMGGKEAHLMVVHIGSIRRDELTVSGSVKPAEACYPNHLGLIGSARVIAMCRPRLAVISEFGEEMKAFRIKLVETLDEKLLTPLFHGREPQIAPRVVPGDLAFIYDLENETFLDCVSLRWEGVDKIHFSSGIDDDSREVYYFSADHRNDFGREPGHHVRRFCGNRGTRQGMYFKQDGD